MIETIKVVGEMVAQKVTKPDGSIVRYQYGKPGDATGMKIAITERYACEAIAMPICKTVDRNGDILIQKVTKNDKLVGYQHGNDTLGWVQVRTLAEARLVVKVQKENA